MKLQTAVTADRAPLVELSNWNKATVNSVLLFRGVYFIQPNPSQRIISLFFSLKECPGY